MKRLTILTLFLVASATLAAAQNYVGYRYRNVPPGKKIANGFVSQGGALMPDMKTGVAEYTSGSTRYLWLETMVAGTDDDPEFIVRDVLVFRRFPKNQRFDIASSLCTLNGREKPNLVVLVEDRVVKGKTPVVKAWLVNVKTRKFEAISVKGISCEDGEQYD